MTRYFQFVLYGFCSMLFASLLLGCDRNDYKARIQAENDAANPSGNKSACVAVGDLTKDMYPYTIHYLNGEIDYKDPYDKVRSNNRLNLKLSLFAKEGLFSQELVGYDGDNPLYRYDLTEQGRQYVDWWGGTNFCFGRIVVDSIKNVDNGQNGVGGGNLRTVSFSYHLENIPNWIQNKDIYSMYPGYGNIEDVVQGKQSRTAHYYSVSSDGQLKLIRGKSGGYVL